MSDAKAAQLVNQITSAVKTALTPELSDIGTNLAQVRVELAAVLARLAVLEKNVAPTTAATKRAVTTKSAAAAPKAAAKGAAAGTPAAAKAPTNAMYFLMDQMQDSESEIFKTYYTDANTEAVGAEITADYGAEPDKYWRQYGDLIWKKVLSDADKNAVRASFKAWKENEERSKSEAPLVEEAA